MIRLCTSSRLLVARPNHGAQAALNAAPLTVVGGRPSWSAHDRPVASRRTIPVADDLPQAASSGH